MLHCFVCCESIRSVDACHFHGPLSNRWDRNTSHRPYRSDRIVCVNDLAIHFLDNGHFHRTLAVSHALVGAAVVAIAVAFVGGHVLWLVSLLIFPVNEKQKQNQKYFNLIYWCELKYRQDIPDLVTFVPILCLALPLRPDDPFPLATTYSLPTLAVVVPIPNDEKKW